MQEKRDLKRNFGLSLKSEINGIAYCGFKELYEID